MSWKQGEGRTDGGWEEGLEWKATDSSIHGHVVVSRGAGKNDQRHRQESQDQCARPGRPSRCPFKLALSLPLPLPLLHRGPLALAHETPASSPASEHSVGVHGRSLKSPQRRASRVSVGRDRHGPAQQAPG